MSYQRVRQRWRMWHTFMTLAPISVNKFTDAKNTVLGDGFAIELISLEVNQEYPLDYSEHIESTLINDIWIVSILNLTPNWQFNTRKSTVQLLDQTP